LGALDVHLEVVVDPDTLVFKPESNWVFSGSWIGFGVYGFDHWP